MRHTAVEKRHAEAERRHAGFKKRHTETERRHAGVTRTSQHARTLFLAE